MVVDPALVPDLDGERGCGKVVVGVVGALLLGWCLPWFVAASAFRLVVAFDGPAAILHGLVGEYPSGARGELSVDLVPLFRL